MLPSTETAATIIPQIIQIMDFSGLLALTTPPIPAISPRIESSNKNIDAYTQYSELKASFHLSYCAYIIYLSKLQKSDKEFIPICHLFIDSLRSVC